MNSMARLYTGKKKKKEEKVAWNMSTVVIFTKDKSEK